MQPLVTPERVHLTADQVTSLIRDTDVVVSYGCELLTGMDLLVAETLTDETVGGSVARQSYANIHGSASLVFERELPFESSIVRPFMTIRNTLHTARFSLGAYFTASPTRELSQFPVTYSVQCYDILAVLDDEVGDAFGLGEGDPYLTAVETILQSRGIVKYLIDQAAGAEVLPSDRMWPPDEGTTWLTIVNDLLNSVGYAGVWSDWDGTIRCERYMSPRDRGPEWVYDTEPATSMLGNRSTVRDYYDAPNRWIFIRSNRTDEASPVEGDGRYTFVNDSNGDTSVESRGRTITKVVMVDAANQLALETAAQRTIDADMFIPEKITVSTFPNPLHWHFDVVYLADEFRGMPTNVLGSSWTLPLDGSDMSQEWTVIS